MHPNRMTYLADSPDATHLLAESLAPRLAPGDVLLLEGGLGAGKTHFARGLIFALLDDPEEVPSPTYTLVQSYPGRTGEIWHADLYRITDISEIEELGLSEAFEGAVCLVEWPDRLGDLWPADALLLTFEETGSDAARRIGFSWSDPRWADKLKDLPVAPT